MQKFLILFLLLWVWVGCDQSSKKAAELERQNRKEKLLEEESRPLIFEGENGEYVEWYPGHKQKKMEGRKNSKGQRVGVWKFYFENGVVQSVGVYKNGKKDGIYIVRYVNNLIRYRGEYEDDEQIGEWKFYDEEGNLVETKDYSKE